MLFHVVNLGCKVNRVESDAAAAHLLALGWQEAQLDDADLVVVNTCTVTGEAEKKTRKAVRHALSTNETALVVVTGCAVAITPAQYEALSPRVRVVPKAALLVELEKLAATMTASSALQTSHQALPVGEGFRTRVGVKIQDGCNHACTYCIVHVARGRSRSRDAAGVVAECRALAQAGVKEIVLTGINLGCYEAEFDGKKLKLPGLLRLLLEATADACDPGDYPPRFRIGSIEPCDVDEDLIEVLATADGRVARHLHLPLQSGCTRVLREMARPYTSERFRSIVYALRESVPTIALSTDIIVGFPGETEDDFAETVQVARDARFMKIHVFPYSMREGTPAAARSDQVAPKVKAERAARLREVSDELAAQDRESRRGVVELALVEQEGQATLESYHEVSVPGDVRVGSLVPITL